MKPSVGRIVHYTSYGTPRGEFTSQCRAAVITEVGGLPEASRYPGREISSDDEVVSLAVLNPTGAFFDQGCLHDEEHAGGTWHWPEPVE